MLTYVVPHNLVCGWQERRNLSKEEESHSTLGSVVQTDIPANNSVSCLGVSLG